MYVYVQVRLYEVFINRVGVSQGASCEMFHTEGPSSFDLGPNCERTRFDEFVHWELLVMSPTGFRHSLFFLGNV